MKARLGIRRVRRVVMDIPGRGGMYNVVDVPFHHDRTAGVVHMQVVTVRIMGPIVMATDMEPDVYAVTAVMMSTVMMSTVMAPTEMMLHITRLLIMPTVPRRVMPGLGSGDAVRLIGVMMFHMRP